MPTELATVNDALSTFLSETCPQPWQISDAETLGASKTHKVTLTYDQGDVSTTADSQRLPDGWVGVAFLLVLSTPETNASKGLPRLNAALGDLLAAIDQTDQIMYTDATRVRLETGENAYWIPVIVLATYLPAPAVVPDDPKPEEA